MIQRTKVYLLYDCDTNKPASQDGNLYVASMTKNTNALQYMIGVENLLDLPADFDYNRFNKTTIETNKYGCVSTIASLDKIALAKYITNLPTDQLKIVMKNIKTEIDTILHFCNI